MKFRYLLIAPLLLLATACGSKYPFPPQFVSTQEVSERSIPAPPEKGSRAYDAEIVQIIALQATLTPAQLQAITHQDEIRPQVMIEPVLGTRYDEAQYPAFYTLLRHAASDAWRIRDETADYWKSPRPWYADPRVALHVEPIYSYGYPSGHTTTFGVWAYVLADLFPQHAQAFFDHAWGVADNRIKGGAHFPHDIQGGKQLAAAIYARMQLTPEFRKEFAAAQAELRQ
jgi:acid phosphatase (class A)